MVFVAPLSYKLLSYKKWVYKLTWLWNLRCSGARSWHQEVCQLRSKFAPKLSDDLIVMRSDKSSDASVRPADWDLFFGFSDHWMGPGVSHDSVHPPPFCAGLAEYCDSLGIVTLPVKKRWIPLISMSCEAPMLLHNGSTLTCHLK